MNPAAPPAAASPAAAAVSNAALPLLLAMLRSQAYRELAAVQLLQQAQAAVADAQERLRLCHQQEEEAQHLQAALALWSELTGKTAEDLRCEAQARLELHPLPPVKSALDVAMAQFVFDRAGFVQLSSYVGGSCLPYSRLAEAIVREEAQHQEDGGARLLPLVVGAPELAQATFEAWLEVSLRSFGRPGTTADTQAVALGLKRCPASALMQSFVDDLRPVLAATGLRFPLARSLNVELPPQLRL